MENQELEESIEVSESQSQEENWFRSHCEDFIYEDEEGNRGFWTTDGNWQTC